MSNMFLGGREGIRERLRETEVVIAFLVPSITCWKNSVFLHIDLAVFSSKKGRGEGCISLWKGRVASHVWVVHKPEVTNRCTGIVLH